MGGIRTEEYDKVVLNRARLDDINNLIIEIASGNFNASKPISSEMDDFDAVITGINMLGEELKHSTVSKDYLDSIFRSIIDMIIVLTPDNKIQQVNGPVIQLLKFDQEELINQPISKFIKGSTRSLHNINSRLQKNKFCHGIEKSFKSKDKTYIPVSCSASYLYDNNGNVSGILYVAKDISHLKKVEQSLISKNKELDTFVYKVSHDIKGPLASIIGITSIVNQEITDQVALTYFDLIKKCSEKLDTILKNLLQLAVMEQSRKERTKINFKKLIQEVSEIYALSPSFSKESITVKIKQENDFYNNAKMLHSVLQNLIDNSFKYRKEGIPLEVSVSISEKNNGIHIKIKDNGIGIKTQYQSKIFDMFFRASYKSDGTGLGLYMVKSYVERMGGDISVKSIENEGTAFSIYLPNIK
ncbi:MAG: ATP-binding protein [Cytophagaceae bacterium]